MESIQNEMLIPHARSALAAAKRDMQNYGKGTCSLKDMLATLKAMDIAFKYKFMLR